MECQRRRGRRGRGHSYASLAMPNRSIQPQLYQQKWSFTSSATSFLIMTSLIGIIYLMLDYHCTTCSAKCDLNNLTKSIEEIARNLTMIRDSYHDLEMRIIDFSHELPKVEGQLEILEALTSTMGYKDYSWDPKTHLALPNVDIYLAKPFYDDTKYKNKSCMKIDKSKSVISNAIKPNITEKPNFIETSRTIAVSQD